MAGGFLSLEILGHREALRNLEYMPDTVRAILLRKTGDWIEELEGRVIDNILSRLNKNSSGKLAGAVQSEVRQQGSRIEGEVWIEGIPYAKAQEQGASIPAHIIEPKNAKVLAFIGATGDKVFALRVFHPGAAIPPTFFMKDAYREMGPLISKGIKKAIVEGIRAKMRSA